MATKCIDCGEKVKNRGKKTKRCRKCADRFRSKNALGRKTGTCLKCGKKLSTKENKTNLCKPCSMEGVSSWNKGIKGTAPWNKGLSMFASKEDYKKHVNSKRKLLRDSQVPLQKFPDRIRTLIRNSIKFKTDGLRKKGTKTELILGCSINDFISHIESQFSETMSWANYGNGHGRWNIDHIKPIASFNLLNDAEIKAAFNYKNCRPMWAIENIKKGARLAAAILTFTVTY